MPGHKRAPEIRSRYLYDAKQLFLNDVGRLTFSSLDPSHRVRDPSMVVCCFVDIEVSACREPYHTLSKRASLVSRGTSLRLGKLFIYESFPVVLGHDSISEYAKDIALSTEGLNTKQSRTRHIVCLRICEYAVGNLSLRGGYFAVRPKSPVLFEEKQDGVRLSKTIKW